MTGRGCLRSESTDDWLGWGAMEGGIGEEDGDGHGCVGVLGKGEAGGRDKFEVLVLAADAMASANEGGG